MVEFIAFASPFVALLIAIPMIGNLIDVRQTAVVASRYASANIDVEPNQLWGDVPDTGPIGAPVAGAVFIDASSAVATVPQTGMRDGGVSLHFGNGVERAGQLLDWAKNTEWDLTGDGLISAQIQVDLHNNNWLEGVASPQCGSGSNIYACVRESNAIMVDGWSAGSDAQARQRVRSLVPASGLTEVGDMLSHIGAIPVFKELRRLDGAFGHVDMNVLPSTTDRRLQSYQGD